MNHICKGRYLLVLFQVPSSLGAFKKGHSWSSCRLSENQEPNGNTRCSAAQNTEGAAQDSLASLIWKVVVEKDYYEVRKVRNHHNQPCIAGGPNVLRTASLASRARKIHHKATTSADGHIRHRLVIEGPLISVKQEPALIP